MAYLFHLATLVGIFATLSLALNLLVGQTDLLSLASAMFFGIGAYATALLSAEAGWGFVASTLAGSVLAAVASLAVSVPSSRLKGDFYAIATLGMQLMFFGTLNSWTEVTGGAGGISGPPRPVLLGVRFDSPAEFALLANAMAILTALAMVRIDTSALGRVLNAIREDELFARSLGKRTMYAKIVASGVSASASAVAGSVFAAYMLFVSPTSFGMDQSVTILTMVVVGGTASSWGGYVGAALLISIPELLRFMPLSSPAAAHLRQLLFGAILVAVLFLRPQGLLGRRWTWTA